MHICGEEIMALAAALPFIGAAAAWARVRWRRWRVGR